MIIEETPAERLDQLRWHLRKLSFGKVTKMVLEDRNLERFIARNGEEMSPDHPNFATTRASYSFREWERVEKSYSYYYGFADTMKGSAHFKRSTCVTSENLTKIIWEYDRKVANPPKTGDYVVGTAERHGDLTSYEAWQICSDDEHALAMYLAYANTTRSHDELRDRFVGKFDRAAIFAHVVALNNMEGLLEARLKEKCGAYSIDSKVKDICINFHTDFWREYNKKALDSGVYSSSLEAPANFGMKHAA